MRLNEYSVKALEHRAKRYDVWDEQLPRFGLRIGSRRKTFIVNTGKTRKAIGVYPHTSLKDARDQARRILFAKYLPAPSPHALKAAEEFLRATEGQKKRSTLKVYSIYLRRLPNTPLTELSPRMLYDVLPQGRGAANLCFNVFKAFLSWCVERGYLDNNFLLRRRQPNKLRARDRLLTDDEIRLIWHESFNHNSFGAIIRILILTGQRINQIANLDRQWVRGDTIVFPAAIMKANAEHTLPLTPILQQHLYFPPKLQLRHARLKLQSALPIPHWTPHDTRRYLSSTMSALGVPIDITEAVLAHTSGGSRSQIQRVYDRDSRLPQMRSALQTYQEHVLRLAEQKA